MNMTNNHSVTLTLLTLASLLLVGLLPTIAQGAGETQRTTMEAGGVKVELTYDTILNTDQRFTFSIKVTWNGTSSDLELRIELNGQEYLKSLKHSETSFAQVIPQNTFETDALNSEVTFTLLKGSVQQDQATGTVDINYEQADDLIYLYLGYSSIWAGVFVYVLYLHHQGMKLEGLRQRLNMSGKDEIETNDDDE